MIILCTGGKSCILNRVRILDSKEQYILLSFGFYFVLSFLGIGGLSKTSAGGSLKYKILECSIVDVLNDCSDNGSDHNLF